MDEILRQKDWSDEELKAAGFQYYEPVKRLVMAKLLVEEKDVNIEVETITGKIGDFILYTPGDKYHPDPDEYDHWPVRSDIFFKNYRPWDEPEWKPNEAEQHLLDLGCYPYYKIEGVWAQRLRQSRKAQSLESPEAIEVPAGRWLIIGSKGEPYNNTDDEFRKRYIVPQDSVRDRIYWATVSSLSNSEKD